jgi:hypothetical protein
MELAEVTRRTDADEQPAQAEREDVACIPQMERPDVRDEQIPNHCVEESPKNVNPTFAVRANFQPKSAVSTP